MVKASTNKMGFEKMLIWGLIIFVGYKILQEWNKSKLAKEVSEVQAVVIENVEGTETKRVGSMSSIGTQRICHCKSLGASWSYTPRGNEKCGDSCKEG
jgi:hypothetical protein